MLLWVALVRLCNFSLTTLKCNFRLRSLLQIGAKWDETRNLYLQGWRLDRTRGSDLLRRTRKRPTRKTCSSFLPFRSLSINSQTEERRGGREGILVSRLLDYGFPLNYFWDCSIYRFRCFFAINFSKTVKPCRRCHMVWLATYSLTCGKGKIKSKTLFGRNGYLQKLNFSLILASSSNRLGSQVSILLCLGT